MISFRGAPHEFESMTVYPNKDVQTILVVTDSGKYEFNHIWNFGEYRLNHIVFMPKNGQSSADVLRHDFSVDILLDKETMDSKFRLIKPYKKSSQIISFPSSSGFYRDNYFEFITKGMIAKLLQSAKAIKVTTSSDTHKHSSPKKKRSSQRRKRSSMTRKLRARRQRSSQKRN